MHGTTERFDQRRSRRAQFCPVVQREIAQDLLALRSQLQEHFAPVGTARLPAHISGFGEAIHEFDRAVMLDVKARREFSDTRPHISG